MFQSVKIGAAQPTSQNFLPRHRVDRGWLFFTQTVQHKLGGITTYVYTTYTTYVYTVYIKSKPRCLLSYAPNNKHTYFYLPYLRFKPL